MTWLDLHRQSEEFATRAKEAISSGDASTATRLYEQAADREEQALQALDRTKVRTRAITAVSAVALWYKAAAYDRAESLAYSQLADASLPQFARTDLRNLVQAIWTESSKRDAGVRFLPGQVFVSVKGGEVITGGAPLDLIVEKVQMIQSMFYRTVEYIRGMPLRTRGGPVREVQEACRPWLLQAPPGSYQFAVVIQEPQQADFFREDMRPQEIASHFLQILRATTSDDRKQLEVIVPKPDYRNVFLKLSRNLAPTGKTFSTMELRTGTDEQPVTLTPDTRMVINGVIEHDRPHGAQLVSPAREQRIVGILRAVDLNKDYLDLSVNDKSVHILGLGTTMDDVIGPMVNKSVTVRCLEEQVGQLLFVDIELND
jgi:hypothetical protein